MAVPTRQVMELCTGSSRMVAVELDLGSSMEFSIAFGTDNEIPSGSLTVEALLRPIFCHGVFLYLEVCNVS